MSTDTESADVLAGWLQRSLASLEPSPAFLDRVAHEVASTSQRPSWWPMRTPAPMAHPGRSPVMSAIVRIGPFALAAIVAGLLFALSATPGPSDPVTGVQPSASAPASPAIVWQAGPVRLTASAIRIRVGDRLFTGDPSTLKLGSDASRPGAPTLEAEWVEQGVEQRLYLYVESDETAWWVKELRTYDGYCDSDWVYYFGRLFMAPIGAPFEGDVRLDDGRGRLRDLTQVTGSIEIDDLTLDPAVDPLPTPTPAPPAAGPSVTPWPSGVPIPGTGC